MNSDRYVSIDELAYRFGIGRSTIYRRIKDLDGFPKPIKLGNLTRFRESDIEAFIKRHQVVEASS